MRQFRPIRRSEVKKLSIIRNPGTGPLLERLREKGMAGPIGFHQPTRKLDDYDWWNTAKVKHEETPEQQFERLSGCSLAEYMAGPAGGK